jgi:hypothetical protein
MEIPCRRFAAGPRVRKRFFLKRAVSRSLRKDIPFMTDELFGLPAENVSTPLFAKMIPWPDRPTTALGMVSRMEVSRAWS